MSLRRMAVPDCLQDLMLKKTSANPALLTILQRQKPCGGAA